MHRAMKIVLHLGYWLVYLLFAGVMSFKLGENATYLWQNLDIYLMNWVWAIIAFYALYFYGYKFFAQKRYVFYMFWTGGLSLLLGLVFFLLFWQFIYAHQSWPELIHFYSAIPGTFIIANCGSLLKGFESWFDAVGRKEELEQANLRHELENLRAQINPHFLFNTLNNIDSLIHTNPDAASESLLRLSEIMRYILYTGSDGLVDIALEVAHIENVIALQSLRLRRSDAVVFERQLEDGCFQVAPLLFVPFVENAFKYASFANNGCIKLSLTCTKARLDFCCVNPIDPNRVGTPSGNGGIGLANVRRRLQLLYPERHQLEIHSDSDTFTVQLTILPESP